MSTSSTHYPVIVIGGGQAGLAISYCLKQRGIEHLVLEKDRMAEAWRSQRWDNFCLVTPNWQCALPGFPYNGPDPNGFMVKDQIVQYIEDYAAFFNPPLHEGAAVKSLHREPSGLFHVSTSTMGEFTADQVVLATGGYQEAKIPRIAERLPADIFQVHSSRYKNAAALPEGAVLVVGTGQSGCQIAEDLHLDGRQVYLATGSAPRTARRYRGRDVVDWLADMGYYDMPVHQHKLGDAVRARANHYVTGRDGGRDIDLRRFASEGMRLFGRLEDFLSSGQFRFAPNLADNLDGADRTSESIKDKIDEFIALRGLSAPTEARYVPVWQPPAEPETTLDLAETGIRTVIWSMGFRTNYSWVDLPIFNGRGYPSHQRGVTALPGVYFIGLPWLYTWGSGRFSGIASDAEFLADRVAERVTTPPDLQLSWALEPHISGIQQVREQELAEVL